MADVLVTGATGFLGSVLTRRLLEKGRSVRIYRRETSSLDLLEGIERDVEHCVGEISDPNALREAMPGVANVFHVAARVGFGGPGERRELMRINVDGTSAVVNAALRVDVERLVHVSSMAAFGRPDRPDGPLDEESEWQRSKVNSVYAQTKYLSELEVRRAIAEGLEAVIVNPALMFGVGRTGENTREIVDRIRRERLPAVPSGGTNVVDVQDVVDGILLAMQHGRSGERYFLGSENLQWEEIIGTLADEFGVEMPRLQLSRRPAMALAYISEGLAFMTRTEPLVTRETARSMSRTYHYSNQKAQDELGWHPRPFRKTAARIAAAIAS